MTNKMWVKVKINDVPIKMEFDSGSAVSIMNNIDMMLCCKKLTLD